MALRKGFLHRDISIGNALMLDPPVKMEPFAEEALEQHTAQLCLQEETKLDHYVALLKKMIKELGPQDLCRGFSIDGDMAASLEDYFTPRSMEEKSVGAPNCVGNPADAMSTQGTYEFMSKNLADVLWDPQPYLHSPVDDLESFWRSTTV